MVVNDYLNYKTGCRRTLTIECDGDNIDIDLLITDNKGNEKLIPLNLNKIEAKKLSFALHNLRQNYKL